MRWPQRFRQIPPGIAKEVQGPLFRDGWIQLAQGPGRGIAGIGEGLIARRFLSFVQGQKLILAHIDFTAHFQDVRPVTARQGFGHIGQGAHIGGNIFAFCAIAARCGIDQTPLFIAQRRRQAVDLWFCQYGKLFRIAKAQKPAHAGQEFGDIWF